MDIDYDHDFRNYIFKISTLPTNHEWVNQTYSAYDLQAHIYRLHSQKLDIS